MSNSSFPLRILVSAAAGIFAVVLFVTFSDRADSAAGPFLSGPVADGDSVYILPTIANDIVYNPADSKIYMSIPAISGPNGNSIQTADPASGELGPPIFAGSEPNKIAISDTGNALYASIDGANTIKRFITSTMQSDLEFHAGFEFSSPYGVADLAVPPGYWNIVAVARIMQVSPPGKGVAIFNNGIQAPLTTPGHSEGSDSLAFSAAGNLLYGTGQYSGLKKISVTANGAAVLQSSTVGSGTKIKFSQGKIFTSRGQVVDPESNAVLGQFATVDTAGFVPDVNGRAYYLVRESSPANTFSLRAYDINTFALIGTTTINGLTGDPAKMVRWGANGLAVRMTSGQIAIIQSTLIPTPQPVPTPTTTPSPSPTPQPIESKVDQINIAGNGLAFNQNNGRLYISVPSSSSANGNTVTVVDTANAGILSSTFIGSEPSRLKLARDGSKLYVYLAGAKEFRVFDVATNMPGEQFPISPGSDALDFDTAPGLPNAIAVAQSNQGIAIYDSGVPRPQIGGSGNILAFSDSASTLYAGDPFYSLSRMAVTSAGIGSATSIGYISGSFMRFQDGRVYGSRGQVADPSTGAIKGSFPISSLGNNPRFVIVPEHNRILYLSQSPRRIYAYELDTFRPIGSIPVPGFDVVTGFERIDTNGVAISQTNSVLLIRSALVDPSLPVPAQTPSPTPTPTPSPTPDSPFVRRVEQPNNDMLYNPADQTLYVSVPGAVKDGTGNTITRIDPQTGQIVSSTFIGSEPTRLGLSENNQVLFTNLAGAAHVIRMFDTVNQTSGLQFPLTHSLSSPQVYDLAPVPGSPNSVVVSTAFSGTAVYDNGVQRPKMPLDTSGSQARLSSLEFSATPTLLYGNVNNSLYRMSLDAQGLTTISRGTSVSGGDMVFAEGKLYTVPGPIVDPETGRIKGTLPIGTSGTAICVDVPHRKVFIAVSGSISVFDMDTFLKIGSIPIPSMVGTVTRLVRWGVNGLAMRVDSTPDYVQIIQSKLIAAEGTVPSGVSFNAATQTLSEVNSSALVTVVRSGDLSATSSVKYATADETALAGQDYTATIGALTFAPGESVKTFNVPIINDTVFENGAESFRIDLSNPNPGMELIYPATRTVVISDNEAAPRISGADLSAAETRAGGTTTATVQVTLSNRSVLPVTVGYSTGSGTATSGEDFVPASGTLTFAPLENTKTFQVTIIGDNIVEGDENFPVLLSAPTNGSIFDPLILVTIVDQPLASPTLFDYDGDGMADLSVRRPSDNIWYIQRGTAGYFNIEFGVEGDLMAPADYDGDGKTDVAVFRPSNGTWYIFNSGPLGFQTFSWGAEGDLPVPADHDGDGKADLVVFRPSTNTWYIRFSATGNFSTVGFGVAGDKPVVGDFDGDGKADIALYRPSESNWYILKTGFGFFVQTWGETGDVPVPADYDGDGKTDVAVFRPSTGQWFRVRSTAGFDTVNWGANGDKPIPADYDGDGEADVAVFRPSNSNWYIVGSTSGQSIQQYGIGGDVPTESSFTY